MNLAETIIPKSDQLNADDLITGTLTIAFSLRDSVSVLFSVDVHPSSEFLLR